MRKLFSAGLMCLGFVALGVTMSRGDGPSDDLKTEIGVEKEIVTRLQNVLVDTQKVDDVYTNIFTVKPPTEGGSDVLLNNVSHLEISGHAGETGTTQPGKQVKTEYRVFSPGGVRDEQTRVALQGLLAGLKAEEKTLRDAGKVEEAEQKKQSADAIQNLLSAQGPGANAAFLLSQAPRPPRPPVARLWKHPAELQKLQAQIAELTAKRAKAAAENAGAEALAQIDKSIAEVHQQLATRNQSIAVLRELPVLGTMFLNDQPMPLGELSVRKVEEKGDSPEVRALTEKAEALARAAEQLTKVGLEEQARELNHQAEKLRAEAARHQQQIHNFIVSNLPGPPDVQRMLHELRHEVHQLRKEVGELRALLEKK